MRLSEIENHLRQFTVGIAGAGGLGSNCAASLVRAGIGRIVIADFDKVETSNLSRQFYFIDQIGMMKTTALKANLINIRQSTEIIDHNVVLDCSNIPSIFRECDVIVEAFDRSDMKTMIIECVQKELPDVPLIVGSGLAGWGKTELLKVRKVDETLYICGDESFEISEELPPLAPRVSIVASMQANIVLEILMQKH